MSSFKIHGGSPLHGELTPQGAYAAFVLDITSTIVPTSFSMFVSIFTFVLIAATN